MFKAKTFIRNNKYGSTLIPFQSIKYFVIIKEITLVEMPKEVSKFKIFCFITPGTFINKALTELL